MSGKTTKGASISHRKEVHSYYYPVRTGRSNASYRNTLFRTCSGSACFAAALSGFVEPPYSSYRGSGGGQ